MMRRTDRDSLKLIQWMAISLLCVCGVILIALRTDGGQSTAFGFEIAPASVLALLAVFALVIMATTILQLPSLEGLELTGWRQHIAALVWYLPVCSLALALIVWVSSTGWAVIALIGGMAVVGGGFYGRVRNRYIFGVARLLGDRRCPESQSGVGD